MKEIEPKNKMRFFIFIFIVAIFACKSGKQKTSDSLIIDSVEQALVRNRLADFQNLVSNFKTTISNDTLKKIILNGSLIVPIELFAFNQLDTLIIENDKLSSVPDSVFLLNNLKYLSLSQNPLQYLPDFSKLENLKKLDLSFCLLANDVRIKIPNSLEYLDLSSNEIENLEIIGGRNLRSLTLTENKLMKISQSIYEKSNLEQMKLFMSTLNDTISLSKFAKLKYIQIRSININHSNFEYARKHGIEIDTELNSRNGPIL